MTPKGQRAAMMLAGSLIIILLCAIIAQIPPPTDANSMGPPEINIENENCYCHTNSVTGKEPDPAVIVIIDPASPDKMVTGGTINVGVTIQYDDAHNDTTYGFSVDLDSADGINITLTAPGKPQTLRFTVVGIAIDADGTEKGDHWNRVTKEFEIHKIREVDINATVTNKGDLEAKAFNVSFLVDGDLIGIVHVDAIPAGGEQNISYVWDATFYDPGEYDVEVIVDSNETTLELNEGNNKLVKTVVLEPLEKKDERKYDRNTILYGFFGAIIIIGVVWILYRRFS